MNKPKLERKTVQIQKLSELDDQQICNEFDISNINLKDDLNSITQDLRILDWSCKEY